MRQEFARHVQSDIQPQGNAAGFKSLLEVVEAVRVPCTRNEACAVIAREPAVGGQQAAAIAPGDEGVDDGVACPWPNTV